MLSTERGSPDGTHVYTYVSGVEYDLPPDLAAVFLRERWAVEAILPAVETPKGEVDSVDGKREDAPAEVALPHEPSDALRGQIDAVAPKAKKGKKR